MVQAHAKRSDAPEAKSAGFMILSSLHKQTLNKWHKTGHLLIVITTINKI